MALRREGGWTTGLEDLKREHQRGGHAKGFRRTRRQDFDSARDWEGGCVNAAHLAGLFPVLSGCHREPSGHPVHVTGPPIIRRGSTCPTYSVQAGFREAIDPTMHWWESSSPEEPITLTTLCRGRYTAIPDIPPNPYESVKGSHW